MRKTGILIAFVWMALAGALRAQQAMFDGSRLQQLCLSGACMEGTRDALRMVQARGLAPEAANSQIAVMASVLFAAAKKADRAALGQISQALRLLARYSSDSAQQGSLLRLAGQITRGEGKLFDLASPFAVSPS